MLEGPSAENFVSDGLTDIANRVFVVSRNTAREALRQRLLPFTLLFAIALVIALSRMRELTFGASELRFIVDIGFGAIDLFGSVLTIAMTAQLFFSELEHRTVFTLLAKPVSRGEFLLGKLCGVAQITALFCAVLGSVVAITLWLQANEVARSVDPAEAMRITSIDYVALLAAAAAQWLKLLIVAATTLLVASFARTQLFTLAMSFLLCMMGHLQDFAQAAAMHGSTTIGKIALKLTLLLTPNFRLFDFSGAITGESTSGAGEWLRAAVYGGAYAVLFLAVAMAFFRRREL